MRSIIAILLIIFFIILTFFITAYIFNSIKDNEINDYEIQINDLKNQLNQHIGTEDMFIGTWNRTLGDPHNYYATMVLNANKTGILSYSETDIETYNYSFVNGKLVIEKMGYIHREFNYLFYNDHTLIMVGGSEDIDGFSVYRKI